MNAKEYGIITRDSTATECVPKIIKADQLADYIREAIADGCTIMETVPIWDSNSRTYFDGLFSQRYMVEPVEADRLEALYSNWVSETNDPTTEEWREELTEEEAHIVEAWDDGWDTALNGMRYGSVKNHG